MALATQWQEPKRRLHEAHMIGRGRVPVSSWFATYFFHKDAKATLGRLEGGVPFQGGS